MRACSASGFWLSAHCARAFVLGGESVSVFCTRLWLYCALLGLWTRCFVFACRWGPVPPAPRRYTLTHNDLTGELQLSVGGAYNMAQISSWYNRLIRCAFGCSGAGTALCSKCSQRGVIKGGRRWYVPRNCHLCVRKQVSKLMSCSRSCQRHRAGRVAASTQLLLVWTPCWSSGSISITVKVYSAGSVAQTLITVMAGMRCWPSGALAAGAAPACTCTATSAARSAGWRRPACATSSSGARCHSCGLQA